MQTIADWRPMGTAPQTIDRISLNHLTLGPILAEGRPGRWYSPSASRQVWRWHRPSGDGTLEPFSGWLPYDLLDATILKDTDRLSGRSGGGREEEMFSHLPPALLTSSSGAA